VLQGDENDKDSDIVDRRQSIAYFCNINNDALVEPIPTCVDQNNPSKYKPVTAGDYLLEKHYASMASVSTAATAEETVNQGDQ